MSIMFEPLRKYASFSGRARRREYWLFSLFVTLVSVVLFQLSAPVGNWADPAMGPDDLSFGNEIVALALGLFLLLMLLPSLAVTIRRLHDSNRSGWWWFIGLLPVVGGIVLLIFYLMDGTEGPNRFGADPKGRAGDDDGY
jgi:uncharacterized membrane protein YhaH (DUF805 family)